MKNKNTVCYIPKEMQKIAPPDLEALINSLSEAILIVDKKTFTTFVNKTGEEFLGRSCQEIVGRKLADILPGTRAVVELARKAMREVRSFSIRDVEVRTIGDSKVDIDISPFITDGRCHGSLLSVRKTPSIAEQDDPSFDSLVYLLGTIAHEIKNPLGGIKGAAQLLKRKICDRSQSRIRAGASRRGGDSDIDYLNLIIRETDRLDTVLQGYLTMSKKPTLQQINIHEVLEKAISVLDISLRNGNISLQRFYDPSLPKVIGDGGKLLQVFLNLIKNALEAMPRGGNLSISTRPSREHVVQSGLVKRWAVISIRDSGRGIPRHEIRKIFLPFYTSKKKGTGLGLALSKKIIKDHNGFVRVEIPENGKGTLFHVYIPFAS